MTLGLSLPLSFSLHSTNHTRTKNGLEPLLLQSRLLPWLVWCWRQFQTEVTEVKQNCFCFILPSLLKYHSVVSIFQRRTMSSTITFPIPSTLSCTQKVPNNVRRLQPLKLTLGGWACQSSFPSRWAQSSCPWACGLGPGRFYCAAVKFSTVSSVQPQMAGIAVLTLFLVIDQLSLTHSDGD